MSIAKYKSCLGLPPCRGRRPSQRPVAPGLRALSLTEKTRFFPAATPCPANTNADAHLLRVESYSATGVDEGYPRDMLGSSGGFWEEMGAFMLFTGAYRRAIDDKLRLPIPKPLRDSLPEGARFFLTPGLDGCLAVYPETEFAALAERLAASSPAAREVRDYSRLFYSQAACVTPDRQWRFRVPPELTKWAGLAGEVMIVGVRDHIEIWALDKWQQYVSRCDPQYDHLAELALVAPVPQQVAPSETPVPSQPR
jgi:MraZ protein